MAKQMGFYFDASACNGCKACVIACKSKNALPTGINFRQVVQYGGGGWIPDPEDSSLMCPSDLFAYSISSACMHCMDPKCLEVCPTTAIYKRADDGLVLVETDKCIGCRYCEWVCPYGAPQFNEDTGLMMKCDFCADLLAQGEDPFCTSACVMRALEYGDLEELKAKHGNLNAVEPLPPANITQPSIVITPHRDSQLSGEGTGRIISTTEVFND
jgi:anaerobic dimethyl sulfoxide reductase subunit B (iron-sulfur subunit)